MARIRTYETDTTISNEDKILGTDGAGGINATSNFTVGDLKDFIESGINVVLKVPKGYPVVIDQDNTDVVAGNFRQDLTQLSVDVRFAPTGLHNPNGHFNVIADMDFDLVADGSSWRLEVINWKAGYYLPSLIGKTVSGTFGSKITEAKFTVDAIHTIDDKDYYINDNGYNVYTFDITLDADTDLTEIGDVSNSYRSFNILAADNTGGTLQEVLISFFGDVDMSNVHIDELDVDRIIFNQSSNPSVGNEGIHFQTPGGDIEFVQDANNLRINGESGNGFRIDLVTQINHNLGVSGTTTTGQLDVTGTSTLRGDVTANQDVSIHGDAQILNSSELDFKLSTDRVENIDNFENVIINFDGISKRDHDNNDFPITYVFANEARSRQAYDNDSSQEITIAPTNEGVLTSIQIGDKSWTIPTASSQVAQLLPGLSENLSPTTEAITSGRFFYGIDKGVIATYEADTNTQLETDLSIPAGAITVTIPEAGGDDNDLNQMFSGVPFGQRLFFVQNSDNAVVINANEGDDISAVTYEVVSYVHSTRVMTFTKLGSGNLIISAPTLSITNVALDQNTTEFLTLDDDLEVKTKSLQDVVALSSVANYSNLEDANDFGFLKSIEFDSGPHNHNVDAGGGALVVNVTGGMFFGDNNNHGHIQVSSFQALIWHGYILGTVTTASTVTLPDSSTLRSGDIVRIANLSDVDENGQQLLPAEVSELWSVVPFAGDRIMKLPADEEVVLNEAGTNEFIWSGNAAVGWIIK